MSLETQPHKQDQPGLRGHSHDPEQDLLKQFVIAEKRKGGGYLWLSSYKNELDAGIALLSLPQNIEYVIIDQFNKEEPNKIVFEDLPYDDEKGGFN